MEKIKIMVADDVKETRELIIKLLSIESERFEIVGEAENGKDVIAKIPKLKPDIVLMDINMPILNGLEATEIITNRFPSVIVIIMSVQAESEYLKSAMSAGAKEYIIKPLNFEIVVETISKTFDKNKDRVKRQYTSQDKKETQIVSFFSSKGGVGKSVLALNSAVQLGHISKKQVLLLDLDLQFGDIAMLVNKHNAKTLIDAVDDGALQTYEEMEDYIYRFNDHLDIIFAPKSPESAEYINKNTISQVMKVMSGHYDVIIADTGVNYTETNLTALDASDFILFVTSMELSALKNTKLGLNVMKSLNYDSDKVKVVVNMASNKFGINEKDIVSVFGETIFGVVPEDLKIVRNSVNKGIPFCESPKNRNTKVVKGIQKIMTNLKL